MTPLDLPLLHAAAIGIGATAVMDVWLQLLNARGIPSLNFALLGRWVGHIFHGRWSHDSIGKAAPVRGERALGWLVHYLTGIAFALVLGALVGPAWLRTPTVLPALAFGIATVLLPFLVMQPAMGSGFASSRTPSPAANRARSLANHTVFGLGLYVTALALASSVRS